MGSRATAPTTLKSAPRFSVVTWNARALLTRSVRKRRAKLQVLDRVLHSGDAVLLQELHGTEEEAALALFRYKADWHIELNVGLDRSTGGTAVLIRRSILKANATIMNDTVVSGRVQRTEICAVDERLVLWNIHNEKMMANITKETAERLRRDVNDASQDPMKRVVWCAGDWNFLAPGDSQMSIASPTRCTSAADISTPARCNQKVWQDVLDLMVEFQQLAPTHFTPSSLMCSRIDRIYTSMPGWILTTVRTGASLLLQPRELHEKGISDHAPVTAFMSYRGRLPKELQPIPRHIAECEHFKKRHDALVAEADLRSLPPVQRWERHKAILRQAGEFARNALLNGREHTEFQVNQTLSTIARTVWHNDVRLARKLTQCSSLAKQHLRVTDAEVTLLCPQAFQSHVEDAKAAYFAKVTDRINSDHPEATSVRKSSKLRAVTRLARLWAPTDKRLVLAAVKVPSTSGGYNLERRPELRTAALASGWLSTFCVKKINEEKARSFCAKWCVPAAWHLVKPISRGRIRAFTKNLKHSEPGPDGLPYAAWDSDAGAETLLEVNDFLASGYSMPIKFSDQLMLFAAKGEEAEDAHEVCRSPGDTRPLSLKNSDNKIIAGVNNHVAKPMLAASAVDIQSAGTARREANDTILAAAASEVDEGSTRK